MQKIIVNADDLGINQRVNQEIEKLIKEGLVTSSTIMSNGNAFEEAVQIAKKNAEVSYGVHLCIDDFSPLVPSDYFKMSGMVDSDGRFMGFSYINVVRSRELEYAIYNEWKAQIQKVIDRGVPVSHIDSHHHAHCDSFLTPIYMQLANEFNIRKVRITLFTPLTIKLKEKKVPIALKSICVKKTEGEKSKLSRLLFSIESYFSLFQTNRKLKRVFDTTDFFCSYRYFLCNRDLLGRFKTIEVMVHPGHPSYVNETNQLIQLRQMSNIKLINYQLI